MKPIFKKTVLALLFLGPLGLWISRPAEIPDEAVPLPMSAIENEAVTDKATEVNSSEPFLIPSDLHDPAAYNPALPPAEVPQSESKDSKFDFTFAALEAREVDTVRLKGARVAVDYRVNDKQSIGVETSQQIYDRQDAKAWGKSASDESTAGIKYKLKF